MKILKILENKNQIKYSNIAKELNISRQDFYYHLKNLKNNKITFNIEQIKIICRLLDIDISIFLQINYTKKYKS